MKKIRRSNMTLTEKVKDITEFYYRTAEFMCDNRGFFKKQFGTFDKFNKVFADIILHEYEKICDDVKNDTTEEKKLVEIVENLKKETKND